MSELLNPLKRNEMTKLNREGKGVLKTVITDPDNKSGSTIIIGPVRTSYVSVFKTKLIVSRKANMFSMLVPIQKEDTVMLKFVRERIQHALIKKFGKAIPKFDTCLKDGDVEVKEDGSPLAPGCMYISTLADEDQAPLIYVPGERNPVGLAYAADWVSGCWANTKLDVFGYDSNGNKGVSTRLKAVQWTAKDAAYGKGAQDAGKVSDEFGEVEGVDETADQEGDAFLN